MGRALTTRSRSRTTGGARRATSSPKRRRVMASSSTLTSPAGGSTITRGDRDSRAPVACAARSWLRGRICPSASGWSSPTTGGSAKRPHERSRPRCVAATPSVSGGNSKGSDRIRSASLCMPAGHHPSVSPPPGVTHPRRASRLRGPLRAANRMRAVPVGWARFGPLSGFIARRVPTLRPPLLLLAFPRSGSSWVGEILGSAKNALYLREPLSQGLNVRNGRRGTVTLQVDAAYGRDMDRAFLGLPTFPRHVVLFPKQWNLRGRPAARVVIKEVNPLGGGMVDHGVSPPRHLADPPSRRDCAQLSAARMGLGPVGPGTLWTIPGHHPQALEDPS